MTCRREASVSTGDQRVDVICYTSSDLLRLRVSVLPLLTLRFDEHHVHTSVHVSGVSNSATSKPPGPARIRVNLVPTDISLIELSLPVRTISRGGGVPGPEGIALAITASLALLHAGTPH